MESCKFRPGDVKQAYRLERGEGWLTSYNKKLAIIVRPEEIVVERRRQNMKMFKHPGRCKKESRSNEEESWLMNEIDG